MPDNQNISIINSINFKFPGKCKLQVSKKLFAELSHIEIVSGQNYYNAFSSETDFYHLQLGDFLTQNPMEPAYGNICSEAPISSSITDFLSLSISEELVAGAPPYCLIHAGLKGATTPVHYDWDFNWVLNASLKGSKRFILIPPESGWLISPMHNISSLDISGFDLAERSRFLNTIDGYELIIPEGHAILFPSIWWHGAVYENTSTAISVRFGGPTHLRALAILPRHWLLQRIAWKNWHLPKSNNFYSWVEKIYHEFFEHPELNWEKRYNSIIEHYRSWLLELDLFNGSQYLHGPQFNLETLLMKTELAKLYNPPTDTDTKQFQNQISNLVGYIFPTKCSISERLKEKATLYAIQMRQGLRPARGIICSNLI